MLKLLKTRIKNEKGLSLVELLAVIVILGIISAIAVPSIGNIINDSRDKAQISEALSIISGGKLANTAGECTAATSTTALTCTASQLKTYVDGIELPTGLTVTLNTTSKEWSITGYTFAIRDKVKFPGIADGTGAVTEKALKAVVAK